MSRRVIIVESPNKAKTIRQLVGREFEVIATVGHFCDLPTRELGVDVANGFKPTYVYDPAKKDVVAKLRALKQRYQPADIVVASDADREGEAIGWHIARTIGLKPDEVRRAEFHEITAAGVQRALGQIRPLDLGLVAAQEARRILDRLVGYSVSPVVRDALPQDANLSAGRVQSVALRVVVDRELAIRAFTPTEYWSVTARYPWPGDARRHWEASYVGTGPPARPRAVAIADEGAARAIADQLAGPHAIAKIVRKETLRKPPPPPITSTMLQMASTRLKMSTDETTRHAKTLFEKGLVTYIRTDDPSVSPEFQKETLAYLRQRHGEGLVPSRPNIYRAKGAANAQGAHECIRPTRLDLARPEGLDARAWALYQLLDETYLASQCKSARYDVTEALLVKDEHVLKARGRVLIDPGFLRLLGEPPEPEAPGEGDMKPLPALAEGERHTPSALRPAQHWTRAPERFTEASLIKYLEARGIGRPSTYNALVTKIRQRAFVETVDKRFLAPTAKGERLDAELRAAFEPVIKEDFTAELEVHLDAIAARQEEWRVYMQAFWLQLDPLVQAARLRVGSAPRRSGGASPAGKTGGATRRRAKKGDPVRPSASLSGAVESPPPPCPRCKESFTRRIHSAKTGLDYFVCGRDTPERRVCGFIMGVADLANPPCPVCQGPTRRIEGKGFGCIAWQKGNPAGSCTGWVNS